MYPNPLDYQSYLIKSKEINDKLLKIDMDVRFNSNFIACVDHPEFQELVAMGDKIVCYIMHRIVHAGCDWTLLLLLKHITGVDPVVPSHQGLLYHTMRDWLTWFINSKHYPQDDIYHNLL